MRSPSDKTLLIRERRHFKRLKAEYDSVLAQMNAYRVRATKAEQEAAEWKGRFDQLLAITKIKEEKK